VGGGAGVGVDPAWGQRKLEATLREMLDAKQPTCRSVAKVGSVLQDSMFLQPKFSVETKVLQ
jgi:hypothetical protein